MVRTISAKSRWRSNDAAFKLAPPPHIHKTPASPMTSWLVRVLYPHFVLIWHGFCRALYRGPLEACAISNRTRGTPRSRRDKPLSVSRCFRKVIPETSFGRNRNLARSQLGASSSYQIRIRPLLHQNLKCMLLALATSVPNYDPQITTYQIPTPCQIRTK